jgi:hypothetical protein
VKGLLGTNVVKGKEEKGKYWVGGALRLPCRADISSASFHKVTGLPRMHMWDGLAEMINAYSLCAFGLRGRA